MASEEALNHTIQPTIKAPAIRVPPYFWGEYNGSIKELAPSVTGYTECREFIGDGSPSRIKAVIDYALECLDSIFNSVDDPSETPCNPVTELRLSDDLQRWRDEQLRAGRVLPAKGSGLTRAPEEAIKLLNAQDWPALLLTCAALHGCGLANILIGGYDARTVYSNYCVDMNFYWEHGYDRFFPDFHAILTQAMRDPHALATLGGTERRITAAEANRYIKGKIRLEEKHQARLAGKIARVNRDQALGVWIGESSVFATASEAMERGFDGGAMMHDMLQAVPLTDVVDVGSDLCNSELFNALLNTADICDEGVITEDNLRRVYDACAHNSARMLMERWLDPTARVSALLYPWHIINDRHHFLRRAVLGYPKARRNGVDQREADFGETFDADYRTTGFSRPLKNACNGQEYCDHAEQRLRQWDDAILSDLWWLLSPAVLQYAAAGVVDPQRERELIQRLSVTMIKAYAMGFVDEMTWLIAHASQHALQVNFLFEAGMFGSLLDDGGRKGKLDRL